MSEPLYPKKVFPFCAILFREDLISFSEITDYLAKSFIKGSNFDLSSDQFSLANYYEKEMGPAEKLKRAFVFSNQPEERENLIEQKLQSNQLEIEFQKKFQEMGRVVNLDPGFMALEQVVLATGKPYSHRLYLSQGIYAELTFQYIQGKWTDLPWTYPDYRQEGVKKLFEEQRNLLKTTLK